MIHNTTRTPPNPLGCLDMKERHGHEEGGVCSDKFTRRGAGSEGRDRCVKP